MLDVQSRMRMRSSIGTAVVALVFAAIAGHVSAQPVGQPDGAYLFKAHCASCHGVSGKGDGPVAKDLRRQPSDLTEILQRHGGNFPTDKIFRIIEGRQRVPGHGGPDMPVWGDVFRRTTESADGKDVTARIDALVSYLERIQARRGF